MGKITLTFIGQLKLDRPLTVEHLAILNDNTKLGAFHPPTKVCPYEFTNQSIEFRVNTLMGMRMPPNLKCYDEWLKYLLEHFIQPWGYIVNGEIKMVNYDWMAAKLTVTDNKAEFWEGTTIYNREKVKYIRDMEENNRRLSEENKALKAKNKLLKSQLKYQPGAIGAIHAENHFKQLAESHSSSLTTKE